MDWENRNNGKTALPATGNLDGISESEKDDETWIARRMQLRSTVSKRSVVHGISFISSPHISVGAMLCCRINIFPQNCGVACGRARISP